MNPIPSNSERTRDRCTKHARCMPARHVQRYVAFLLLALFICPVYGNATTRDSMSSPILPQPSQDIACEESPFGYQLTIGTDMEMIDLMDFQSLANPETFNEWELSSDPDPTAPPLVRTIDSSWTYYNENALASSTLLKAIRTDLDGDGRDEVLVAVRLHGIGQEGFLRLGVVRREPYTESTPIELFSTWTLNAPFDDLEIAAGDLDGSGNGREELVVMFRPENETRLMGLVLTGNDQGGIAENDNSWSGLWSWQPASGVLGVSDMAAGDVLLNGRDQIVVIAESNQQTGSGNDRMLNYHLLEYQSSTGDALPIQPGNFAVASRMWSTHVGNNMTTGSGGGTGNTIDEGGIDGIKVIAGDVAGDAAQELLILYDFRHSPDSNRLIARIHHFHTSRDDNNAITAIDLARRDGAADGVDYDDSIVVRNAWSTPGGWDAIVQNIDDTLKQELIVAREGNHADTRVLEMAVYKPEIELTANFRFSRDGYEVQFDNTSVGITPGYLLTREWDFGDGATTTDESATHEYAATLDDDPTVTLTLSQSVDGFPSSSTFQQVVHVHSGGNSEEGPGRNSGDYFFHIPEVPTYEATYVPDDLQSTRAFNPLRISAGDMNRDGIPEITSFARFGLDDTPGSGWLRSVWRLEGDVNDRYLVGRHLFEPTETFLPNSDLVDLFVIGADFDGDSFTAIIGADCRSIVESEMRQLIWTPPYFARFQSTASHSASFGQSTEQGTDVESQFGTFTGNDISGYIGAGAGFDLLGLVGASASLRATAGYHEQSARGGIVGSKNAHVLSEGMAQENEDALLVVESNHFNCYTYDVFQATGGIDPDSSLRICEILDPANLTSIEASDPEYWNREFPQPWASGTGGHPPPNWAPVTRDWNSVALFRDIATNATLQSGTSFAELTDGRFTTHIETASRSRPYVEIDLGRVVPIANIRLFAPEQGYGGDLAGFRVYTSTMPMPESGLPSGADVHVFTPDTLNGAVYDRWNVWTRVWNPSDPGTSPGDAIPMRYIRLQHPGEATINIAEIQAFADGHTDPPRYPDAICDPVSSDGLFLAKVWDPDEGQFRPVEVHGDVLWTGTGPDAGQSTWDDDSQFLDPCTNHEELQDSGHNFTVWDDESIGSSGILNWSFANVAGESNGTTSSFETSRRVGAEFETELTAFVSLTVGGAEEFESGVTEEHQSVNYWTESIDMGGGIEGFQEPYNDATYVNACKYNARPYAYKLVERSDVGYEHTAYAVDYVVPEGGQTAWTRANLPSQCQPQAEPADVIFRSGFD